jgi:hypothetical protein
MANEIGVTEVDSARQAVIANIVQMTLKQESVLIPTVSNFSSQAGPGAKSVAVNRRTQFSSSDKTENTDLTAQEISFVSDTINLSKHKAIFAKLERIAGTQANVNVQAEILMEQAKELALQIDKDLIVQLKLASAAAPDHRIASTASIQTDLLEARRLLNVAIVPAMGRWLVVSPDKEKTLLSASDFVRADSYGSAAGLQNGELGKLYGTTVIMHTGLVGDEMLYYHPSHVGFAMQLSPEYATNFDLKSVSDEFLLHQIYGTIVFDGGKRGVLINASGT